MNKLIFFIFFAAISSFSKGQDTIPAQNKTGWHIIAVAGTPEKREDCSFVESNGLFYLIGGRGIKPVEVFNPKTNTWERKGNTPVEMNHFQAIAYHGKVYIVGAMNGHYPHEKTITNIYIYDTRKDEWEKGPAMPSDRLRGSGGSVVYKGKIYLACGIQDGHYDGTVGWMDEFDPATGNWRTLPDAPHARDHVQAVVIGSMLYLAGGRQTSGKTKQGMELTVAEIDRYDFNKQAWQTIPASQNLPKPRAGASTVNWKGKLVILSGESIVQKESLHDVDAYDAKTSKWVKLPALVCGRHDSGAVSYQGKIYIAAGSANSGGGPDLNSIEVLAQ